MVLGFALQETDLVRKKIQIPYFYKIYEPQSEQDLVGGFYDITLPSDQIIKKDS